MKKIGKVILFTLFALCLFAFCACNEGENNTIKVSKIVAEVTAEYGEPFPPADHSAAVISADSQISCIHLKQIPQRRA